MSTKIKNGRLVLPDRILEGQCLYYEQDRIMEITDRQQCCDEELDAKGCYVAPGFIDIHVHGGGGYDFLDGGTEAIVGAAELHLSHGTTTLLPTATCCSDQAYEEFFRDLRTVLAESLFRGRIPGAHMEGPFFAPEQCGAQNPDYIRKPKEGWYTRLLQEEGDLVKRWSFAPELPGSETFCRTLMQSGVIPSIGHSNGVYQDVEKVYREGCRLVTHLYSSMSTITKKGGFRSLGVIESTFLLEGMIAEVIADGCHLPPELLRMIFKIMGTDHVCLVTDAMRGAGMPEGLSFLGRRGEETPCIIEDGVAKLMNREGFAGSVATADRLVRTVVKKAGLPVWEAVKMMTVNPATVLGRTDLGILQEGGKADLVIFDEDIHICHVIADGNMIY